MSTHYTAIDLYGRNNVLTTLFPGYLTCSVNEFVEAHTRAISGYSVNIHRTNLRWTKMTVHGPSQDNWWGRFKKYLFGSTPPHVTELIRLTFDHERGDVAIRHLKKHRLTELVVAFELTNYNHRSV